MALIISVKFFVFLILVSAFIIGLATPQSREVIIGEDCAVEVIEESEANCRQDEFECRNGACIEGKRLCNGRVDCLDQSDETRIQCTKPEITCPDDAFRCDYGACAPADAACNGVKDCFDNSDELLDECPTTFRRVSLVLKLRNIGRNSGITSTSRKTIGVDNRRVNIGTPVTPTITCSALNSPSRSATCFRIGNPEHCGSFILPYTKAKVSCNINYKPDMNFSTILVQDIECRPNGKWEPEPIVCIPECGVASDPEKQKIEKNGVQVEVESFPWHASIWVFAPWGTSEYEFRCSATIIKTNFVVTNADCVTGLRLGAAIHPADLSVTTSKGSFSGYKVKSIHKYPCGNRNDDYRRSENIALVELLEPFEFSDGVFPVCLDDFRNSQWTFTPGAKGTINDYGKTSETMASRVLRTIKATYLYNDECPEVSFKDDEFCANLSNETTDCDLTSGGGLVVKRQELWYLSGISYNRSLGLTPEGTEIQCNPNSHRFYTKVAAYTPWIEEMVLASQRNESVQMCTEWPTQVTSPRTPTSLLNLEMSFEVGLRRLTPPPISCSRTPYSFERELYQLLCSGYRIVKKVLNEDYD